MNFYQATRIFVENFPSQDWLSISAIVISLATFIYTFWIRRHKFRVSVSEPRRVHLLKKANGTTRKILSEEFYDLYLTITFINLSDKPLIIFEPVSTINSKKYMVRTPWYTNIEPDTTQNFAVSLESDRGLYELKSASCNFPYVLEGNSAFMYQHVIRFVKKEKPHYDFDINELLDFRFKVYTRVVKPTLFIKSKTFLNLLLSKKFIEAKKVLIGSVDAKLPVKTYTRKFDLKLWYSEEHHKTSLEEHT